MTLPEFRIRIGTLVALAGPEVIASMLPDPPPPPSPEEQARARVEIAVADMRRKVRSRLRGATRARFLDRYRAEVEKAEGLR